MNSRPSRSSIYRLILSVALVPALTACPQKNSANEPVAQTTKVNPLSIGAAACELKMRQLMQDGSLLLVNVDALGAEIATANQSIASTNKITYAVTEDKQVTDIKIDHQLSDHVNYEGLRYSLSIADANSSSPLNLSVSVENIKPDGDFSIEQSFNVDDSCVPHLAKTEQKKTLKIDATNWSYDESTFYSDGLHQTQHDHFSIPTDAPFFNTVAAMNDGSLVDRLPPHGYAYIPKIGVLTATFNKTADHSLTELGRSFTFKGGDLEFLVKGQSLFTIFFGEDHANGASLGLAPNGRTLDLPKALFDQMHLGSSRDLNTTVSYQLPALYFDHSNSILLLTKELPQYDHFKAYWTITKQSVDSKGQNVLVLSENATPKIADTTSTPDDLASNDTIQTDLPQIQATADAIRAKSGSTWLEIHAILKYLKTNYTYDEAMVKNNIIRPLTTEEALKLGKGVCQHYAVIYTAIARALKIPTRIVFGYNFMGDNAGGHAWVESEIEPGVWRAIEPQDQYSLTEMQTRYYYPIARATFLEDKNQNMATIVANMINLSLTIKPAP